MPSSSVPRDFGDLLDRLNGGDAAARDELITRAQEHLKRRVHQMLGDFPAVHADHRTSDVAQDASLRLYDALAKVRLTDSYHFLRLLARKVRHTLLDLARITPRACVPLHANGDSATGAWDPACTTNDPISLARWTEFHEYVDGLPDDEQVLFDLLVYQALSQKDAAKALGVSTRTLKRRWLAARLRLGRKFGA